jgi:S1-C subfamily serine protease
LGAAVLALATLAAIVFGVINFQQRSMFAAPDDGVSWIDVQPGVVAWHITPHSPAANAGLRAGDRVLAINDVPIHNSIDVTKRLWRIGLWSLAHYQVDRGGKEFQVQLVVQPAERPSSIENYLSVVGMLYLFIGLFIFARR